MKIHHYGGAPALAELVDLLDVDRFALHEGMESSFALEHLVDYHDGAFLEYARRYAPDQVDELGMMTGPEGFDEHERVVGLLEDVVRNVRAAIDRGETERDETGLEHYRRSPESFRVVAGMSCAETSRWLRGNAAVAVRPPAAAGSSVAARPASRARGRRRPRGRAKRSSARSGDSGGGPGEPPPGAHAAGIALVVLIGSCLRRAAGWAR
jgi:hypothetical protein